jgi:hypothetical protein
MYASWDTLPGSKQAQKKRRRSERDLAVVITGDLNEKSLASLAIVGGSCLFLSLSLCAWFSSSR